MSLADRMTIRGRLSKEDIKVFPASLYRADTPNEPAEEYNDEAAVAAMQAFVDHGLAGIKAAAEQ